MATQMILSWKLRKNGIAHCTDYEDITNAFPSVSHEAVSRALEGAEEQDKVFMEMHIETQLCKIKREEWEGSREEEEQEAEEEQEEERSLSQDQSVKKRNASQEQTVRP